MSWGVPGGRRQPAERRKGSTRAMASILKGPPQSEHDILITVLPVAGKMEYSGYLLHILSFHKLPGTNFKPNHKLPWVDWEENRLERCYDGSAAKSTFCSCRWPEFDSQAPCLVAHKLCLWLQPIDSTPLTFTQNTKYTFMHIHTHTICTCTHNTHTNNVKTFK